MKRKAQLGITHLRLHKDILESFSKHISALAYDQRFDEEQIKIVLEHVTMLARSLPELNFRHDKENGRIYLQLKQPLEEIDE